MSRPASLKRLTGSLTCLALLVSGTSLSAQQKTLADDKKTESEEAIFIPVEYRPPPWQASIGVRLTGKAKVKFGGLGSVPRQKNPGDNISDVIDRTYDNGYVAKDFSVTPGTLPSTETATQINVDDGRTNFFGFSNSDQVINYNGGKALKYTVASVSSRGTEAVVENGANTGWDIEISRELGGTKRLAWGLIFGAGLSDLNAKNTQTIQGTLHTTSDIYSIGPAGLPMLLGSYSPYSDSGLRWVYAEKDETITTKDAQGNPVTTTRKVIDRDHAVWSNPVYRISDRPNERVTSPDQAIDIEGTWSVKGAYITARLGPYFGVNITERLRVRASAGLTFTILGTQFRYEERYYHPVVKAWFYNTRTNHLSPSEAMDSNVTGNIGYFISGELDWFLTQRTGIFIGALHEDYARKSTITDANFEQFADIDVSAGTVLRTGITTRF